MLIEAFDSTRPACLPLDAPPTLPKAGFAELSARYGGQTVEITNRDARVVSVRPLCDLRAWFDGCNSKDAEIAAIAGHVVHWVVPRTGGQADIRAAFDAISQALKSSQPETDCVLNMLPQGIGPDYAWVIFGPNSGTVRVHQDMMGTASWNYLISGFKRWSFWSPEALSRQDNPTHIFDQSEGDLIWIPEKWWHSVSYQAPSICLSRNIVPARSSQIIQQAAQKAEPRLSAILLALAKLHQNEVA